MKDDDSTLVPMDHIHQQLKQLVAAQQAIFTAMNDLYMLQEQIHLITIHTQDMFNRWPFVKPVGGKK